MSYLSVFVIGFFVGVQALEGLYKIARREVANEEKDAAIQKGLEPFEKDDGKSPFLQVRFYRLRPGQQFWFSMANLEQPLHTYQVVNSYQYAPVLKEILHTIEDPNRYVWVKRT